MKEADDIKLISKKNAIFTDFKEKLASVIKSLPNNPCAEILQYTNSINQYVSTNTVIEELYDYLKTKIPVPVQGIFIINDSSGSKKEVKIVFTKEEQAYLAAIENLLSEFKEIRNIISMKRDVARALTLYIENVSEEKGEEEELKTIIKDLSIIPTDQWGFGQLYTYFDNQLKSMKTIKEDEQDVNDKKKNRKKELTSNLQKILTSYQYVFQQDSNKIAPEPVIHNQHDSLLMEIRREISNLVGKYTANNNRPNLNAAINALQNALTVNNLEGFIDILETQALKARKDHSYFKDNSTIERIDKILTALTKAKLARALKKQSDQYERAMSHNEKVRKENQQTQAQITIKEDEIRRVEKESQQTLASKEEQIRKIEKENLDLTHLNLDLTQKLTLNSTRESLDTSFQMKDPEVTDKKGTRLYERRKLFDWVKKEECFLIVEGLLNQINTAEKQLVEIGQLSAKNHIAQFKYVPDVSDVSKEQLENTINSIKLTIFNLLFMGSNRKTAAKMTDYLKAMQGLYADGHYLPQNLEFAKKFQIRRKQLEESQKNSSQQVVEVKKEDSLSMK